MHLGYKWLITQKTPRINAKQQAMASGYVHHQSFFCHQQYIPLIDIYLYMFYVYRTDK